MRITARLRRWFRRPVRLELAMGDITKCPVDVIVNAAKASLLGGGGVDGAIHAAGGPAILQDCKTLRADVYPDGLPVGEAVATTAGHMLAQHVIHTVGPDRRVGQVDPALLRACYINSLKVADKLGARDVAFPLISAGVYGWPKEDAIVQALTAIRSARPSHVKTVWLVVYDQDTYELAWDLYDLRKSWS